MKAVVIINANSGTQDIASLHNQLRELAPHLVVETTYSLEDFNAFMETALNQFDIFIIAGGDGSVNTLAHYLVNNPNKAMAVIPHGSGNGFANETGFKVSLRILLKAIQNPTFYNVDTLKINGRTADNVVGLGFDGAIAHAFDQFDGRGLKTYIKSFFKEVTQFKPFEAKVHVNGKQITGKFASIITANAPQFGNDAFIAPHVQPDSGTYELVLVKPIPLWAYPKMVVQMFNGTLRTNKFIEYHTLTKECTIISQYNKLHIDGEPASHGGKMKVTFYPGSLKLLRVPQ